MPLWSPVRDLNLYRVQKLQTLKMLTQRRISSLTIYFVNSITVRDRLKLIMGFSESPYVVVMYGVTQVDPDPPTFCKVCYGPHLFCPMYIFGDLKALESVLKLRTWHPPDKYNRNSALKIWMTKNLVYTDYYWFVKHWIRLVERIVITDLFVFQVCVCLWPLSKLVK